jgi:hypothetical protein
MRPLLVPLFILALVAGATSAQAESRIFIVSSYANDYRGAVSDGQRKVQRGIASLLQIARVCARHFLSQGSAPRDHRRRQWSACNGGTCEEFVAIACER